MNQTAKTDVPIQGFKSDRWARIGPGALIAFVLGVDLKTRENRGCPVCNCQLHHGVKNIAVPRAEKSSRLTLILSGLPWMCCWPARPYKEPKAFLELHRDTIDIAEKLASRGNTRLPRKIRGQ
jgi:hypothetical protein